MVPFIINKDPAGKIFGTGFPVPLVIKPVRQEFQDAGADSAPRRLKNSQFAVAPSGFVASRLTGERCQPVMAPCFRQLRHLRPVQPKRVVGKAARVPGSGFGERETDRSFRQGRHRGFLAAGGSGEQQQQDQFFFHDFLIYVKTGRLARTRLSVSWVMFR
jgi:hypothetical protein